MNNSIKNKNEKFFKIIIIIIIQIPFFLKRIQKEKKEKEQEKEKKEEETQKNIINILENKKLFISFWDYSFNEYECIHEISKKNYKNFFRFLKEKNSNHTNDAYFIFLLYLEYILKKNTQENNIILEFQLTHFKNNIINIENHYSSIKKEKNLNIKNNLIHLEIFDFKQFFETFN